MNRIEIFIKTTTETNNKLNKKPVIINFNFNVEKI